MVLERRVESLESDHARWLDRLVGIFETRCTREEQAAFRAALRADIEGRDIDEHTARLADVAWSKVVDSGAV